MPYHRGMSPIGFNASYARLVADHVRAQDHDPAPVLAALGLPAQGGTMGDITDWVSARKLTEALHIAREVCADPHLALRVATQVRPANMGSLGYALISCSDMHDGLAMFERLQALVCTEVRAEHRLKGEHIETRLQPVGGDVPPDTDLWIFTMMSRLAFARWVAGRHLVPEEIRLPCPAPEDAGPLLAYVGGPVVFEADTAGERVPAAWLQLPNPHADPHLHRVMSTLTQQQWALHGQKAEQLLPLLRQAIARQLQLGELPLLETLSVDIEDALGLSARQIQRRLAEQALSFKDLVEDVRRQQVLAELRDTTLPLVDIARRAAYAEVSSMHRAVKRWTGLTPLAVRQAGGAGAVEPQPGPISS